jgi:hypothetical protein
VKSDRPRADRATVIARDRDRIEPQRQADLADEVGEKKDTSLEHRDDGELAPGVVGGDALAHRGDALAYPRLIEEDALQSVVHISTHASHGGSRHRSDSSFNQNI